MKRSRGGQQRAAREDVASRSRRERPAATPAHRATRRFPVVGMGASAGGLEALQDFFKHMPPDSGMAFVVVQHLDPHHETLMPELLGRSTRMPVQQAKDRTPVEPDHVYIIPPNASLTIESGRLRVKSPRDSETLRAPIDGFFRSLAEDQGERAICILLSGGGSDGTLGLRSIKEHGGMAIAQAAESARHDSIPRSAIATGLVDHVLPAGEMPKRLVEYVAHLEKLQQGKGGHVVREEEAADDLARIFALVRRKTGHDFSQYKPATLIRRIQRRMLVLHIPTLERYVERLRLDPKEIEQLFKDLLIGVTQFFRDPEAFAFLGKQVIPKLLERAGPDDPLRIWTAGCATGEEAYSLAILVSEAISRRVARTKVQIFAGDIDDDALDVARHARYPEGIASHVSRERLERFFVKQDHSYQLKKEIREMCIFSSHDLIKDPPFSRLDLIVCRNLLIYLEPEAQKQLAGVFHYALRPGGYLFLGSSESLSGAGELFRTVDKKHRVFQRNETIAPPRFPFHAADPRKARALPAEPRSLADARKPGAASVQALERILVESYSPAWVVINAEGEVVYFSPRTGRYLEPPAGAPSSDLVGMARKGLRLELRAAIHRATKSGDTVVHEDVAVEGDGELQRVNLIVRPLRELGPDSGLFMVVFQELGPPRAREQVGAEGVPAPGGDAATQQLEGELKTVKEHLQAVIEELETSNEELTSSNEELLSTNEEMQSTNEEMQTSKEEVQSINEELETVNAELRKKIEELDAAHADLQNLFASTEIATLFLDNELRINRFTPAATEVFRLKDADVGRSIEDIAPRFAGSELVGEMKSVLRTLAPRERRIELKDGSTIHLMRLLPYRRLDGAVDGVVAAFMDVTELTRAQEKQHLAAIMESSQDAIVSRTLDGTIISWNPSATRMFGYAAQEALGGSIAMTVPPEKARELEDVHERAKRGEAVEPFETERMTKDGRRVPVSVSISAVKDADGNVVAISSSFRDLSELARAKQALQDEMRRKDEFLAMLSHELRNPLAPLRTCLDVLSSPSATEEQASRAKEIMERQANQLTSLVNELLDVSRISSGKIVLHTRTLDLVELVRAAAEDCRDQADGQRLTLRTRLPSQPLWIEGDPTRLLQAIGNVLHNAIKFTESGAVEVGLEALFEGGVDTAVVTVRDTGVGMDAEMLDRLFKPFSQADRSLDRSRGGLGLGLALTRSLVESHGGTVVADSGGPNQGSLFTLRLPLVSRRESAAPLVYQTPIVVTKGPPRRVLIVEDQTDAAESLSLVLELAGHHVEVAADGPTALETARRFKPEVVLCDIGLPGGMSGYQVAEALRADPELASARLIALTGYGLEQEHVRAIQAGFDVHVTKPIEAAKLQGLLAKLPLQR